MSWDNSYVTCLYNQPDNADELLHDLGYVATIDVSVIRAGITYIRRGRRRHLIVKSNCIRTVRPHSYKHGSVDIASRSKKGYTFC